MYPKSRYAAEGVCFECHVAAWQYALHESVELSAGFDSWSRALAGADHGAHGPRRRIAPKAIARFKEQVRTDPENPWYQPAADGQRAYDLPTRLDRVLWDCQTPSALQRLETWIRRRLRSVVWKQCKQGRTRFRELRKRAWAKTWRRKLPGVPTARGASQTRPLWPSLCRMLTFPSSDSRLWLCGQLNPPNRRMRTRMSGGVAGETGRPVPLCRLNWKPAFGQGIWAPWVST